MLMLINKMPSPTDPRMFNEPSVNSTMVRDLSHRILPNIRSHYGSDYYHASLFCDTVWSLGKNWVTILKRRESNE